MKTSIRTVWGTFWGLDSNNKVCQVSNDEQKFEVVQLNNHQVAIKGPNEKFACAENEGTEDYLICNRNEVFAWETFNTQSVYNGIAFQAVNSRWVCAENNNQDITVNRERPDSYEAFYTEHPPVDENMTLALRGKFFQKQNGQRLFLIESSEFSLYKRFLDGETIDSILEERRDIGFNLLRVWLLNTTVIPGGLHHSMYNQFYDKLPEFSSRCSTFGQYIEFTVFTQTKSLMPNQSEQSQYFNRVCDALRGTPNVLLELVNEYDQHDNDCSDALRKPEGIISSHGSGGADQRGKEPFWDYTQYHTNGLSEWQRKVGHNAMEIADGHRLPCIANENTRYPDNESNSIHAYDAAAGAALLCAGACYHSQSGKFSTRFNDVERFCAQEWVRGAKSVPLDYQDGAYRHEIDNENDNIIRAYSREIDGIRHHVSIRK